MSFSRTILPILMAGAVLASPRVSYAQTTYSWAGDGNSPNWEVPANWTGGSGLYTSPGANGSTTDTVVFANIAATSYATTIVGVPTIANLNVTRNAAWSISSFGSLTVTNGPTITTGALLVNDVLRSMSPFTVPAGGTLGGGGVILGGAITVTGTLSPGGIAGATLTQTTARLTTLDIAFAPGSTFEVGLGASGNDLLDARNLTFDSQTTLRLVNNGFDASAPRTFAIANSTGATPNLNNVIIDASAYAGAGTFALSIVNNNDVQLTYTLVPVPVPEPLATTAIVFGVAAAVVCRRRR